jgi:aryl-alcohol dehydrogenase-like predicted oxidoreductase
MGEGPDDVGLSRKHIREGIEASLRRLQLDHVDLYQAHRSVLSSCGHWPRRRACRWPASR